MFKSNARFIIFTNKHFSFVNWIRRKMLQKAINNTTISLTSLTPIFLQAERKLSTFLLHLAPVSLGWRRENYWEFWGDERLTTAGEGTCMEETALGETWLAIWQRTTPSARAAARSSPSDTWREEVEYNVARCERCFCLFVRFLSELLKPPTDWFWLADCRYK